MKRKRRIDYGNQSTGSLSCKEGDIYPGSTSSRLEDSHGHNSWNTWQPGITLSKLEVPLIVGAMFQWKSGGITINSTVQIVEPNEQIGWTGKSIGTQARHIWTLKSYKDGTLLTSEESMEGWLVKVLKVLMPKFLEDSLDVWLQNLKKQAESG